MKKNFIGIAFMGGALMIALTGCTHVGPQSPIPSESTGSSQNSGKDNQPNPTATSAPTQGATQGQSDNGDGESVPSPTSNPTNEPVKNDGAQDSLNTYVTDYTKFVSCEKGAECKGSAGDISVDCLAEPKPADNAILTGYTIVYSDKEKTTPTDINCSWFTPTVVSGD